MTMPGFRQIILRDENRSEGGERRNEGGGRVALNRRVRVEQEYSTGWRWREGALVVG